MIELNLSREAVPNRTLQLRQADCLGRKLADGSASARLPQWGRLRGTKSPVEHVQVQQRECLLVHGAVTGLEHWFSSSHDATLVKM